MAHNGAGTNKSHLVRIMDKLRYNTFYNSELNILDVYSANMVFSTTLHNHLAPKRHVLMEHRPVYSSYISSHLKTLTQQHTFQHVEADPYNWKSYSDITSNENRLLDPGIETRDHIHSKFLFAGSCHVEGLLMQWLACMGNQNWIHRFGNVRMLIWVPQQSALKIMAPVSTRERNKCSVVREAFSDARVIAMPQTPILKSFTGETVENAIIFDERDFSNPTYPMALVELNPKDTGVEDMFTWDYVTKNMMILKTKPVLESVRNLGPGAGDYFQTKLPKEMLKAKVNSLTAKDFQLIAQLFNLWPFKPETTIEFLSDER